jgi:hypothetical protein
MAKYMRELFGEDVLAMFPDKSGSCSVGRPGKGIRLGYEGWGSPDILLDPTLPLDACVGALRLEGKFPLVTSVGLLNNVHGDCMLSHAAAGLTLLVAPGGRLEVEFLATADLAKDALRRLDEHDLLGAQSREKFCFRPPADTSGIVYQQTFLNIARARLLFMPLPVRIVKAVVPSEMPDSPDDVRLPGVSDEAWGAPRGGELGLRPRCTMCSRVATMMDHDRSKFSRYCKDHYHEARTFWDNLLLANYTAKLAVDKPACPSCQPENDAPIPVEMMVSGREYARDYGVDLYMAAEVDCECDGLLPPAIWDLLESRGAGRSAIIVVGDWRVGSRMGVDVYDAVIKHAEDNFSTIRQIKSADGWYVVVMANRLPA